MATIRLTMAQAVVRFLAMQHSERDGVRQRFFGGCFGIFGHGNVAGIGQALQQEQHLMRYYQTRNEQAMVHTATAYARHSNRLRTLVCMTSIGPGATNMITGAATATINRIPVLLLPGDIFARRNVAPVLQQLESAWSQDFSVNDAFKPVSKYWDRINRPEQIITALPEAMRVLTSPAETGAVTLCLPQDVQTEAYDYPEELFAERTWRIPRQRADRAALATAADWIRAARRPMIVAGGGVIYSEASEVLHSFVERTGIPVGETMAGKGSLRFDHAANLGAVGATGTSAANAVAEGADLVIGIGTRYSDFTTASKTLWQEGDVRFININVAEFDAFKHSALPLVGDARAVLEELAALLEGYRVDDGFASEIVRLRAEWNAIVTDLYATRLQPEMSQAEVIGAVNEAGDPEAVMVCAAGSLPGDLHKLWRSRHVKQYHLEYGNSCMGYEIAGGLGVKMAEPEREVYVMVGDGSWLMLSNEILTSIQEGYKLTVVLLDNDGYKSIGSLSRSLGQQGFGTRYLFPEEGVLPSDPVEGAVSRTYQPDVAQKHTRLPLDLVMNARSLGAEVVEVGNYDELAEALATTRSATSTVVIYCRVDRYHGVPGYAWWDVPVAETSEMDSVRAAREEYEEARAQERHYLRPM